MKGYSYPFGQAFGSALDKKGFETTSLKDNIILSLSM